MYQYISGVLAGYAVAFEGCDKWKVTGRNMYIVANYVTNEIKNFLS